MLYIVKDDQKAFLTKNRGLILIIVPVLREYKGDRDILLQNKPVLWNAGLFVCRSIRFTGNETVESISEVNRLNNRRERK